MTAAGTAALAGVFDLLLRSVVLTNPVVVGVLVGGAVMWAGYALRPDPARQRVLALPPLPARTTGPAPLVSDASVPQVSGASQLTFPSDRLRLVELLRLRRRPGPTPDQIAAELPEIVQVLNVAVASGLSITAAIALALSHYQATSATARWLASLLPDRPLEAALAEFGRTCGPRARSLATAVSTSLRSGVPLTHELDRLSADLREDLRRRLDARVRRLPVLLLFPLVLCVLPALGLVAIVPVLVAAFGG